MTIPSVAKIKKVILESMVKAGELGLLERVPGLDGFTPVKDKDYDSVRKLRNYAK